MIILKYRYSAGEHDDVESLSNRAWADTEFESRVEAQAKLDEYNAICDRNGWPCEWKIIEVVETIIEDVVSQGRSKSKPEPVVSQSWEVTYDSSLGGGASRLLDTDVQTEAHDFYCSMEALPYVSNIKMYEVETTVTRTEITP